jgi:DNA-directed RNA polymerase subunit RPC12/RpoP
MLIRADVKCYYCGYVSGQIEGDPNQTHPLWSYRARTGQGLEAPRAAQRIRCDRCGGPVFLDEIETVRAPRTPERVLAAAR